MFSCSLAALLLVSVTPTLAKKRPTVLSPTPGVLCDRYVCADDKGISRELTRTHLGKKAAANELFTSSHVDLTEFTLANGIFCDVKERLCRVDRYYENGQRSAVSEKYTKLLFGH
ncbi:YcgJ family protein [Comamonas testosteroni]